MENLGKIVREKAISPKYIYNGDELFATAGQNAPKVFTRRSHPKPVRSHCRKAFEHITVLLIVSALGSALPPIVLFPLANPPLLEPDDAEYFIVGGTTNGWMDAATFRTCIEGVFLIEMNKIRSRDGNPDAPVLLILDGHSTRLGLDAKTLLEQHNIYILLLPAHSSALMQPLDLCVNAQIKQILSRQWKSNLREPLPEKRRRFITVLHRALETVLNPGYIKTGFERSGIWPFHPDVPLASAMVMAPGAAAGPQGPAKNAKRVKLPHGDLLWGSNVVLAPAPKPVPEPPGKIKISRKQDGLLAPVFSVIL